MNDTLHELQGLSTDVLTAMKESGGKCTLKAEQRTSMGLFKGVQLIVVYQPGSVLSVCD